MERAPFWFMRQAGRYLPEYRALRKQAPDFLTFCYTPELATEATLQPIRRFGMDAAIIFSDILVIPQALGMEVAFHEGVGPVLTPLRDEPALAKLQPSALEERLAPVYTALAQTRATLPRQTALIGFAGSPWTLACYMVEGKGSRDFQTVRRLAFEQPVFFSHLIDLLVEAITRHALAQIEAGAEAIQLFDSWAGVLSEAEFVRWVIAPTARIVAALKAVHPQVPLIGFPRQAGANAPAYATQTGVDAIGIDANMPLSWARAQLQPLALVQGNLDPVLLAADRDAACAQAKKIRTSLGDNAFIFNLGHGILPHTPPEHVQALCELLKNDP